MTNPDPWILPPYRIQWRHDRQHAFENAQHADGSIMTAHDVGTAKSLMQTIQENKGGQCRLIYQHVVDTTDTKPAPGPVQV